MRLLSGSAADDVHHDDLAVNGKVLCDDAADAGGAAGDHERGPLRHTYPRALSSARTVF